MPPLDLLNADRATLYPRALDAMRNRAFIKSPKYQEQQKRAVRDGAHPLICEFADKMVKRFRELGIPMFPACIIRTQGEQHAMFRAGVSNDRPDDGLWPHMAFAVDIIHGQLGYMDELNKKLPVWALVGHIGKEVAISMGIKIKWGGEFRKLYDPAHFELENWREIALDGDKHWAPTRQASA